MTLELVTTDEMIAELKRRYPLLILAGSADVSPMVLCEVICYNGDVAAINLLLDTVKANLLEQFLDSIEEAPDHP